MRSPLQLGPESTRYDGLYGHPLAVRVVEGQRRRVQAEPVDACLAPSVPRVPRDGAPQARHVEPYLRPSPCVYLDPDQGVGGPLLVDLPVGYRLPAGPPTLLYESHTHVLGLRYPSRLGPRVLLGPAMDDGMVYPLDGASLELLL